MRHYYQTDNVGRCRYSVSFHDGHSTHTDGSPFYDLRIFSRRRDVEAFITVLRREGYVPR